MRVNSGAGAASDRPGKVHHDRAPLWADQKENRPISRYDTGHGWGTVCECGGVSERYKLKLHPLVCCIAGKLCVFR